MRRRPMIRQMGDTADSDFRLIDPFACVSLLRVTSHLRSCMYCQGAFHYSSVGRARVELLRLARAASC
ncbi:protein of unknown function [Burkholderia multivorans]